MSEKSKIIEQKTLENCGIFDKLIFSLFFRFLRKKRPAAYFFSVEKSFFTGKPVVKMQRKCAPRLFLGLKSITSKLGW